MWFGKQVSKRSTFQNTESKGGEDFNKSELSPVRSGAASDWGWLDTRESNVTTPVSAEFLQTKGTKQNEAEWFQD